MKNSLIRTFKKKKENKEFLRYFFWKLGLIGLYKFLKEPKYYIKLFLLNVISILTSKKNTNKYIKRKFILLKNKKSDINEHMETLYKYSLECESIFETGIRGVVSSWAFLMGLNENNGRNKIFLMNDIETCEIDEIKKLSNNAGIYYSFIKKNNLDLNLNQDFDLTFIDTWHVYAQLKRELKKFSPITNKYIILHDTSTDGDLGESLRFNLDTLKQSEESGFPVEEIEKGLSPAIEEFLHASEDWVLEAKFTNCNGLTVLKKLKSDID